MAAKRGLRAVQPDESAPKAPRAKRSPSVAQAAASGTHRDLLVAMRGRIARTVADPNCPPRDLAALTRRLQDIAKEIETIDLRSKQESGEDDAASGDEAWDPQAI
jgi:hypothetical protein